MEHCFYKDSFCLKKNVPVKNLSRSAESDFGLIETGRFINRKMPLWKYHTKRLAGSLEKLSWDLPKVLEASKLKGLIQYLFVANEVQNGKFRLSVFQEKGETTCMLYLSRIEQAKYQFNKGLSLGVFEAARKTEPVNHKYNHDPVYVEAQVFQEQSIFDACLVLDDAGNISDEVISNVWAFKGREILTPSLPSKGVAGVMRSFILDNANFSISEKVLRPEDLETCDEIFLSNSTMGIRAVKTFRGKTYEQQLSKELFNHLEPKLNLD